jgi:hypothetical protein
MLRETNTQIETSFDIASLMPKLPSQPKFKVPSNNIGADLRQAMLLFFRGLTGKAGNYVATENALVYRSISVVDQFQQDVLCLRLIQDGQTFYIGNSSRLTVAGTKVAFGNRTTNWGVTEPQRVLTAMGVPMLPFTAFNQAGLKVTATRIIDQGGAETVKRHTKTDKKKGKIFENVHFTGATLFQNGTSYFLFDIDRLEIEHGVFNPFIVELPRAVKTIVEAYDSLIPLAVRTAQAEGVEVKRQGEHFFIKVSDATKYKADKTPRDNDSWNDGYVEGRMSAQGNRDHVATRFNAKTGFVSGFVKHQGREHLDTDLTSGWWRPVPNTAVKAFTISGDID